MTQTAKQEAQQVEGPRTYQSAWQFGENDAAVLLTAEDWLNEEAEVTATMESDDDPDDRPSRAGILRAIAKEVAALRVERSMWAASHTEHVKTIGDLVTVARERGWDPHTTTMTQFFRDRDAHWQVKWAAAVDQSGANAIRAGEWEAALAEAQKYTERVWMVVDEALGEMREPMTLKDARQARDRLTLSYNEHMRRASEAKP